MRISTSSIFEAGTRQLGTLQNSLARTQMQLSTNRRVLTPSDDPIASARALEVTQSQAINNQYATNRENARASLSHVEVALGSATNLLQDIRTLTVSAGNGGMTDVDRKTLADELAGRLEDLMGIANTGDGDGGYLFSGFRSGNAPFSRAADGGIQYNGDQGKRVLHVGAARELVVADSGSAVFLSIPNGNGTFQIAAGAANTGTGIVSAGTVSDHTKLTGHDYRIEFQVAATVPPSTSFTVTDNVTGLAVPPPPAVAAQPYTSGEAITFDGVSFDIKGAPADGDSFAVKPSGKQSVFETIGKLIDTLRLPSSGDAGQTALANGLNEASINIDAALDNVLASRAQVGLSLKALDYMDSAGDDRNLQYEATLSELQDLDMVKAISDFAQQQMSLEAAQKSFKSLSGLSLFNFIG